MHEVSLSSKSFTEFCNKIDLPFWFELKKIYSNKQFYFFFLLMINEHGWILKKDNSNLIQLLYFNGTEQLKMVFRTLHFP